MASNDKYVDEENKDIQVFLSMLDELHKPDPYQIREWRVAKYVNGFLQGDLPGLISGCCETTREEEDIIEDIIGKISAKIAISAVDAIDIHTTTFSILKILQHFYWETKVAFIAGAYILTYGDKGLNLCANSKVSVTELPNSLINLLKISRSYDVYEPVEFVQHELESSGIIMGSDLEAAWTDFKITVYRAIRLIVEIAPSHLLTRSSLGYKSHISILTGWSEKHVVIADEYVTMWKKLLKVLRLFEVEEENSEFKRLKFEIEAVKPGTIDVNVIDQQLVVKGDRNNLHGPFDQRFQLPNDTRKEEIKAKFGSGILWIDLPKIQKFGQKDITIPIQYLL